MIKNPKMLIFIQIFAFVQGSQYKMKVNCLFCELYCDMSKDIAIFQMYTPFYLCEYVCEGIWFYCGTYVVCVPRFVYGVPL